MTSRSRRRRALLAAILAVATCGIAAPQALGATLAVDAGTAVYTAAAGRINFIETSDPAPGVVRFTRVADIDNDPINPGAGCAAVGGDPNSVDCTATAVRADLGDLNDNLFASFLTSTPHTVIAGPGSDGIGTGGGNDTLLGGEGDDRLFAADGNDTLDGGPGSDVMEPGPGTDVARGGTSSDTVLYFGFADPFSPPSLSVTLDGAANDGAPGENDLVAADVEDVSVEGDLPATIIGNDAINSLSGGEGNDSIDGLGGNDLLAGRGGNDTISARDGFADRVDCGDGADTAIVDTLDQVDASCESVLAAAVGTAPETVTEDRPPSVSFDAPAPGQTLPSGGTTLRATASDDRGIAQVLFIDDDRIVCADTAAPYECAYQPRGEDVGRNTLAAMAVDTSQQSATALRTTVVDRFTPQVSISLRPGSDRRAPFRFTARGRVAPPAQVSPALGCAEGTIAVQVKAGRRTVSTRRVDIRRDCTYSSTVTFRSRARFRGADRLRFTARFTGNDVLAPASSGGATARIR